MSSPESKGRRAPRKSSQQKENEAKAGQAPRPSSASNQKGSGAPQNEEQPSPDAAASEGLFSWTFRDFLIPYILLALSFQRAHGYFIEQYLRGLGLVNVEMSTLYRTLRQLERDGLVYSTWEPGPEGPARRIYSLTDAGRWWLDAGAAALSGYRSIIDRFFGSYSGPAQRPEDKKKRET